MVAVVRDERISYTSWKHRSNGALTGAEFGGTKTIEPKGLLESGQSENSSDISLVEAIEAASQGDSDGKVEQAKVEDLPRVRLGVGAHPNARAASHVEMMVLDLDFW